MVRNDIAEWLQNTTYNDFHGYIAERVVGQEQLADLTLILYCYLRSVAYHQPVHYNTILAAPSGSGKTETYRALRDYFAAEIPEIIVTIFDATKLTPSGFRGSDVMDILTPFIYKKMRKAIGICFLDEVDKILAPSHTGQGTDINAETQNDLLTTIEGSDIYDNKGNSVNTSDMMFIAMGSFDLFRKKRTAVRKEPIGIFSRDETVKNKEISEKTSDVFSALTREDIVGSGGSNELIGRFPFLINYNKLGSEAIRQVIELSRQSVEAGLDCDLTLGDPIIEDLAAAANTEFGCRLIDSKLRNVALRALRPALNNEIPDKKLVIHIESEDEMRYSWRDVTEADIEDCMIASISYDCEY